MIKSVIFDIGNVLVAFDWQKNLDSFNFPEEKREAIADAVYRSSDWNEMDRGVLTLEECTARFVSHAPQYAEDIRKVVLATANTIWPLPYTKELIRTLKAQGLNVYYLSNYGKFGYEVTKDKLDFTELMDGGLYSYEVQMIKPNLWIFAELCERYHIHPFEAVFLDDNLKNVEAAQAFGMKGIHFTGYEAGCEGLRRLGIL